MVSVRDRYRKSADRISAQGKGDKSASSLSRSIRPRSISCFCTVHIGKLPDWSSRGRPLLRIVRFASQAARDKRFLFF
ncbi:unnamed protein product, partial [Nesidiocoris tenuis]